MTKKYLFKDEDGELRWHDYPAECQPRSGWPLLSDGAAVHPSQISEAREAASKSGVPTEFTRDGRPILTSLRHQERYLRSRGLFNHDGVF